ncbi:hypothetical protein AVEN_55589-1 [Araneus ventricosus]|uniref:Uncharacterized protein n=1 Tax=Araneus ventricosus TaxID=182803 RepID=A0A4Y2L425_ARAVE|nr:hypothetical protein AVEN_55589-1 [Araneus ventricosus]
MSPKTCMFNNFLQMPENYFPTFSPSYLLSHANPVASEGFEGEPDTTEDTVTECLSCATEANQLYTDEEIISLVQNKPQDDSDLEETDEPENVLVSHSEAANALETALRYIEQTENATSTDIMFMRRWHNIASTSRIKSLRQTNLTNFFTPNDR